MKHVVITGASRGLGRAMVMGFSADGWTVSGCGTDAAALRSLGGELGPDHHLQACDVTEPAAVEEFATAVAGRFGDPDLLPNNAATINPNKPLWEVSYRFVLITARHFLLLAAIFISLPGILVAADATSVEVFVGKENTSRRDSFIKVPAGTDTLRFLLNPGSPLARYKLEGIDDEWNLPTDKMFLRAVFLNRQGDPVRTELFPVSGRSAGWKSTVNDSVFTARAATIKRPPGTHSITLTMTTAGPASLVGIFAIKEMKINARTKTGDLSKVLMSGCRIPGEPETIWNKSGTHPSMATKLEQGDAENPTMVLVIRDDDLTAHADWTTRIRNLPEPEDGQTIEIRWEEAYCAGLGGGLTATYERLPAGKYRFVVEDLSLGGVPLQTGAAITLLVPEVLWKSFGFWGTAALIVASVSILVGRYLIRRKIRLHLQQERMISEERQRIALDLHDDIGTRVSHISLVASHAGNTIRHDEANKAFGQISAMSRDLIGALSESVWMLNPNNDDLESLVDFLYRQVNELCRLKNIRCRVDAVFITENRTIRHEFRHNMSLAVKESVNNVLKHSHATELDMKIELENNVLMVTITDNGIGLTEGSRRTGLGLDSLQRRMKSIGGDCRFEHLAEGGLSIRFTAPVA